MNQRFSTFTALLLVAIAVSPVLAEPSAAIREKHFSTSPGNLGLGGYDPVSYFEDSGPLRGDRKRTHTHAGITYRFANEANQKAFRANPSRYEPEHGGWCAWAMIDGERTKPNPRSYKMVAGKLYLFYDGLFGDTLKMWNEKAASLPEPQLIQQADSEWVAQLKQAEQSK